MTIRDGIAFRNCSWGMQLLGPLLVSTYSTLMSLKSSLLPRLSRPKPLNTSHLAAVSLTQTASHCPTTARSLSTRKISEETGSQIGRKRMKPYLRPWSGRRPRAWPKIARLPVESSATGQSNLLLGAGFWIRFDEKDKIISNAYKLYLNSTKHMILFWRLINIVTAQLHFNLI